jgi:hypothetical protein
MAKKVAKKKKSPTGGVVNKATLPRLPKLPAKSKPTKAAKKAGRASFKAHKKTPEFKAAKKTDKKARKVQQKEFAKRTAKTIRKQAKKGNVVVTGGINGASIRTVKNFNKGGVVKKKPSNQEKKLASFIKTQTQRNANTQAAKKKAATNLSKAKAARTQSRIAKAAPKKKKTPSGRRGGSSFPAPFVKARPAGRKAIAAHQKKHGRNAPKTSAVAKFKDGGVVKKKVEPRKNVTSKEVKALGPVGGAARVALAPKGDKKAAELKALGPVGAVARLVLGDPKKPVGRKITGKPAKSNISPAKAKKLTEQMKSGRPAPKPKKKAKPNLFERALQPVGNAIVGIQEGFKARSNSDARVRKGIIRTKGDLKLLESRRRGALATGRLNAPITKRSKPEQLAIRRALSQPVTAANADAVFAAMKGKPLAPNTAIAKAKPKAKKKKSS